VLCRAELIFRIRVHARIRSGQKPNPSRAPLRIRLRNSKLDSLTGLAADDSPPDARYRANLNQVTFFGNLSRASHFERRWYAARGRAGVRVLPVACDRM
jgi:hypothetical protein